VEAAASLDFLDWEGDEEERGNRGGGCETKEKGGSESANETRWKQAV
jgi:hypothetical protein